jgi:tRNA G37 N-methylase TrmD
VGKYKQVDDKPFGGGSGMVLMAEPIYQSLTEYDAISPLYKPQTEISTTTNDLQAFIDKLPETEGVRAIMNYHKRVLPNNAKFEKLVEESQKTSKPITKATIMMTPRGYPMTQQVCEWLATNFDELNIICGRYEGFDSRVSELVDLELSVGSFVTNGGEVPAMCMIEGVARLVPGFITKTSSVTHDSFSSGLNAYEEQSEYIIGKHNLGKSAANASIRTQKPEKAVLFNDNTWVSKYLPQLEHPQYTRPTAWQDMSIPPVLQSGNHKKIQQWRTKWHNLNNSL